MGDSVDLWTVRLSSAAPAGGVMDDRNRRVVDDGQAINLTPLSDISGLPRLYSRYRDACGRFISVRVVVASAVVAGLLLSIAPTALAPVGRVFTTAPAAYAEDRHAHDDPFASTGDLAGAGAVQHRSGLRPVAALVTWDGTSQSLKCTFGLLIEGNTRACKDT